MSTSDDRTMTERLGELADELFGLAPGENPPSAADLAERFSLPVGDVERCLAAIGAADAAVRDEDTVRSLVFHGFDEPDPFVPRLSEDYELETILGRGGMGVVWKAHQKSLGRDVAVKVMSPGEAIFGKALRRFEDETRALAKLRHPHIVTIHEVGRGEGQVWFTMDLIEGRTLADEIAEGPLTPSRAVRVMKQVSGAVAAIHEAGLIHRDLKPQNILVDEQGEAFVTDFGLARDAGSGDRSLTEAGQLLGTPAYMSPEQARGDHDAVDETTDVHALGVILLECLTGRPVFLRRSPADTLHAILHDEPSGMGGVRAVPRDLLRIARKAIAKQSGQRYGTAEDLVADLERFESGRAVQVEAPSPGSRFQVWVRQRRAGILTVALVCAITAVLIVRLVLPQLFRGQDLAEAQRMAGRGQHQIAASLIEPHLDSLSGDDLVRYLVLLSDSLVASGSAERASGRTREHRDMVERCLSGLDRLPVELPISDLPIDSFLECRVGLLIQRQAADIALGLDFKADQLNPVFRGTVKHRSYVWRHPPEVAGRAYLDLLVRDSDQSRSFVLEQLLRHGDEQTWWAILKPALQLEEETVRAILEEFLDRYDSLVQERVLSHDDRTPKTILRRFRQAAASFPISPSGMMILRSYASNERHGIHARSLAAIVLAGWEQLPIEEQHLERDLRRLQDGVIDKERREAVEARAAQSIRAFLEVQAAAHDRTGVDRWRAITNAILGLSGEERTEVYRRWLSDWLPRMRRRGEPRQSAEEWWAAFGDQDPLPMFERLLRSCDQYLDGKRRVDETLVYKTPSLMRADDLLGAWLRLSTPGRFPEPWEPWFLIGDDFEGFEAAVRERDMALRTLNAERLLGFGSRGMREVRVAFELGDGTWKEEAAEFGTAIERWAGRLQQEALLVKRSLGVRPPRFGILGFSEEPPTREARGGWFPFLPTLRLGSRGSHAPRLRGLVAVQGVLPGRQGRPLLVLATRAEPDEVEGYDRLDWWRDRALADLRRWRSLADAAEVGPDMRESEQDLQLLASFARWVSAPRILSELEDLFTSGGGASTALRTALPDVRDAARSAGLESPRRTMSPVESRAFRDALLYESGMDAKEALADEVFRRSRDWRGEERPDVARWQGTTAVPLLLRETLRGIETPGIVRPEMTTGFHIRWFFSSPAHLIILGFCGMLGLSILEALLRRRRRWRRLEIATAAAFPMLLLLACLPEATGDAVEWLRPTCLVLAAVSLIGLGARGRSGASGGVAAGVLVLLFLGFDQHGMLASFAADRMRLAGGLCVICLPLLARQLELSHEAAGEGRSGFGRVPFWVLLPLIVVLLPLAGSLDPALWLTASAGACLLVFLVRWRLLHRSRRHAREIWPRWFVLTYVLPLLVASLEAVASWSLGPFGTSLDLRQDATVQDVTLLLGLPAVVWALMSPWRVLVREQSVQRVQPA